MKYTKVKFGPYQTVNRVFLYTELSEFEISILEDILDDNLVVQRMDHTKQVMDFDRNTSKGKTALVLLTIMNNGTINEIH